VERLGDGQQVPDGVPRSLGTFPKGPQILETQEWRVRGFFLGGRVPVQHREYVTDKEFEGASSTLFSVFVKVGDGEEDSVELSRVTTLHTGKGVHDQAINLKLASVMVRIANQVIYLKYVQPSFRSRAS
jgi:hypothetical protein